MTFAQHYLAVTTAIDQDEYVDAANLYIDLLKSEKDRVLAICDTHRIAQKVHFAMATQFALQKILVQRIQGKEVIELDLSLFTRTLPFILKYDSETCQFLDHWKSHDGTIFSGRKKLVEKQYRNIFDKFLKDFEPPKSIDADIYAAHWIVPDFLSRESFMQMNSGGFVSLGCGAGLFECAYLHATNSKASSILIDIEPKASKSVSALARLNSLKNTAFSETWPIESDPPSLVSSIRSCAFLYSVTYYDSLFRSLKRGSRAFIDVRNSRINETVSYFQGLGALSKTHPTPASEAYVLHEFIF